MCCFSRPVIEVSGTQIFARASEGGRQLLVYAMSLAATEPLAMILPLPVPVGSPDDAVRFVNLEEYAHFFDDMARGFESDSYFGGLEPSRLAPQSKQLVVHDVGAFEASFVPSVRDFSRLDRRFRLPDRIWDELPGYRDHGFAVFKLKDFGGGLFGLFKKRRPPRRIHPMAFEFPRRDPSQLFFPTVHVHDGRVHESAEFDHWLYCQGALDPAWQESKGPAREFMNVARAQGLLEPELPCFLRELHGSHPNRDVLVALRS